MVKPDIAKKLLSINSQFYQTFADQFSATRQKLQPGVQSVLNSIPDDSQILDIGCGNGNIWASLARRSFKGSYTGLDFSPELIRRASEGSLVVGDNIKTPHFFVSDLTEQGWSEKLHGQLFDCILAFAVLHHLPGAEIRENVLRELGILLTNQGQFTLSVWQPMNSPRLRARIQDWENAGISTEELEVGDYLIDWRDGGTGLRYVHQFNPDELETLASKSGFSVIRRWCSDGKEGNLGLYQTWVKK